MFEYSNFRSGEPYERFMPSSAAKKSVALTRRLEDYLEAVFDLVRRDGFARVRDIASRTHVSKSSVTAALRQLCLSGLVHHDPYEVVTLTARGETLAEEIRRKHNTLRGFLEQVLNIDGETAEANACRMEHVVDDKVLRRLSMLAEFARGHPARSGDWLAGFSAYCREQDSHARGGRANASSKGSEQN